MAVFEASYKEDMSQQEAEALVARAIRSGMLASTVVSDGRASAEAVPGFSVCIHGNMACELAALLSMCTEKLST